jgi:hypothetical protein
VDVPVSPLAFQQARKGIATWQAPVPKAEGVVHAAPVGVPVEADRSAVGLGPAPVYLVIVVGPLQDLRDREVRFPIDSPALWLCEFISCLTPGSGLAVTCQIVAVQTQPKDQSARRKAITGFITSGVESHGLIQGIEPGCIMPKGEPWPRWPDVARFTQVTRPTAEVCLLTGEDSCNLPGIRSASTRVEYRLQG